MDPNEKRPDKRPSRARSHSTSAADPASEYLSEAENAALINHILGTTPESSGHQFQDLFQNPQPGSSNFNPFAEPHTSSSTFDWTPGSSHHGVPHLLPPGNNPLSGHGGQPTFLHTGPGLVPPQALSAGPSNPPAAQQSPSSPSSPGFFYQQPGGSQSAPDLDLDLLDKRQRNTAASARFRIKKKQRTLHLERTVSELTGRSEELEREAADLRRENGWLREIVMLKSQHFGGNVGFFHPPPSFPIPGPSSVRAPELPKNGSDDEEEEETRGTRKKGKGKKK